MSNITVIKHDTAEDNDTDYDTDDDWVGRVECTDCSKIIDYDDCVHYQEYIFLCQVCGSGLDSICIDCYKQHCICDDDDE
jgi:hypothetical protein